MCKKSKDDKFIPDLKAQITSPLQAQQVNAIYRFVTTVY
jgi:hypothetical protein